MDAFYMRACISCLCHFKPSATDHAASAEVPELVAQNFRLVAVAQQVGLLRALQTLRHLAALLDDHARCVLTCAQTQKESSLCGRTMSSQNVIQNTNSICDQLVADDLE